MNEFKILALLKMGGCCIHYECRSDSWISPDHLDCLSLCSKEVQVLLLALFLASIMQFMFFVQTFIFALLVAEHNYKLKT